MGGEGHMLDMIRRLSEGREASRLRRERNSERMRKLNSAGEHYDLPDTTPEEMDHIIQDSKKKKEKDNSYFVWGTLIIFGILIGLFVVLWTFFFR